jgi:hypothetical protein
MVLLLYDFANKSFFRSERESLEGKLGIPFSQKQSESQGEWRAGASRYVSQSHRACFYAIVE